MTSIVVVVLVDVCHGRRAAAAVALPAVPAAGAVGDDGGVAAVRDGVGHVAAAPGLDGVFPAPGRGFPRAVVLCHLVLLVMRVDSATGIVSVAVVGLLMLRRWSSVTAVIRAVTGGVVTRRHLGKMRRLLPICLLFSLSLFRIS